MSYGIGQYGSGPYGVLAPAPGSVAPVVAEDYLVIVTDRNLTVVGDPITCWTSLDVTLRFNEPSSGIMTVPAHDWVFEQFSPGNRVVVIRNGQVLISGPWEERLLERADNGENSGVGTLTVNFADDLALLANRNVYPDPSDAVADQAVDFWEFTGDAEGALRTLVNDNAGPNALTERQVPKLILGTQNFIGSTVTVKAPRMTAFGTVAREIAESGGGLGFRVRQVARQLVFEVYQPEDRSAQVRFSFGLGNLRYVSYAIKAPTATAVAVGGQGEATDRAMIERVNTAEEAVWGRVEKYSARAGSSPAQELEDEGDRELAEGAATTQMAANVSDSPDQQFATHYRVGDIVSIEASPTEVVSDVVRTVHLQVHATSGEYVTATVGSQAATTDPVWVKKLREIDERLGRVERSVTPG